MTFALIMFTLFRPYPHNPAVYEWQRTEISRVDNLSLCTGFAAALNGEIPFDHDNMPYFACERVN